jgi:hypothetical protein
MSSCHSCHKALTDLPALIGRRDVCPFCSADLHCCKMCVHWDKNAYNECREPMADRQVEKEKANFCDHYKISDGKGIDPAEEKRKQMEKALALFKK